MQEKLDNYEAEHDYDEYHYELDDIEHDPYVLISAITALMGREWTISEVGGILDMLFEKQYILTETVETETRYRTETRTGSYTYYDYELEDWVTEEYEYEVEVPYTYYICTVKLENFNLSHVPVYIMSQELHRRQPDKIYPDNKGRTGSACFIVPKNCISIREPYSEERRRAASERAKQAGYKPPIRGTTPKSE